MNTSRTLFIVIALATFGTFLPQPRSISAQGTSDAPDRIQQLETTVQALGQKIAEQDSGSLTIMMLFLFGMVLCLWAKGQGRNGYLWFILGCIPLVNVISGCVALYLGSHSPNKG